MAKKLSATSDDSRISADQHEQLLLEQIALGDRRAFEQLYFAYSPRVLRFILRMVGNPDVAEELVNDVLLVVWKRAYTFAGRSRVSTWIFGITYRVCLKRLRRQRLLKLFVSNDKLLNSASDDGGFGLRSDQDWLRKGFESLSVHQRAVVELSYFEGYGYGEIAKILDCPVNTVKTRMFHARKKLRTCLPRLRGSDDESRWKSS